MSSGNFVMLASAIWAAAAAAVSGVASRLADMAATATGEKPTLLLIDGHSLAFRAFFALLPAGRFVTSQGQHTEVPYGFITSLLKFMKDEKPTHVAVAFDISRYSFRTREY